MLRSLLTFCLVVAFACAATRPARAQQTPAADLEAFYDQLNAFPTPKYAPDNTRPHLLLPGDFNSQQIAALQLGGREVVRVDLVYSAFRLNPAFNQRQLNLGRLRSLLAELPSLATNPALAWNLVEQTGCTTPAECQEYFHGFVLYLAPRFTKADTQVEADSLARRLARLPPRRKMRPPAAAKAGTKTPPGPAAMRRPARPAAVRCEYPVSRYNIDDLTKRLKRGYRCPDKREQTIAFRAEADNKGNVLSVKIINPPPGGCGPVLAEALKQDFSFLTGFRIGGQYFPMSVTGVVRLPLRRHGLSVTGYLVADSLLRRYGIRRGKYGCTARIGPPDTTATGPPDALAVSNVFARHPDWSQRVVVADVTGSMLPYTADLLTWLQETATEAERTFVFFNDGDDAPDKQKTIGQTGGLHDIRTADFSLVKGKVLEAMRSGGGGDQPENDAEALLRAHALAPDAREIVWLADNQAFPRDTELLDKTKLPVHIILCGTTPALNPKYLALARDRGYTLHTLTADLTTLSNIHDGQVITVQGIRYQATRTGFKQVSTGP